MAIRQGEGGKMKHKVTSRHTLQQKKTKRRPVEYKKMTRRFWRGSLRTRT